MKKEGKGKFPGTEGKQVNRRILIWKHIHPNINMYKYHFLFLIWLNEQLLTIFLLLKRNYVTLEPCLNMLFNVRLKLKLVWQQNPKLLSGVTIGKEVQGRSHEWGGKKFSDLLTSPFSLAFVQHPISLEKPLWTTYRGQWICYVKPVLSQLIMVWAAGKAGFKKL